jgi:hypothetical protein
MLIGSVLCNWQYTNTEISHLWDTWYSLCVRFGFYVTNGNPKWNCCQTEFIQNSSYYTHTHTHTHIPELFNALHRVTNLCLGHMKMNNMIRQIFWKGCWKNNERIFWKIRHFSVQTLYSSLFLSRTSIKTRKWIFYQFYYGCEYVM